MVVLPQKDVRLARRVWPTPADALVALGVLTRGRRVGRKRDRAAMSVAVAARCEGPQGVEARRLQKAKLDEAFGFIERRSDHPPHARRALLLNTRIPSDAAAEEGEPEALSPLPSARDWPLWVAHGGGEQV